MNLTGLSRIYSLKLVNLRKSTKSSLEATRIFYSDKNLRESNDNSMTHNLLKHHFIFILTLEVSSLCFIELSEKFCNWLQLFF